VDQLINYDYDYDDNRIDIAFSNIVQMSTNFKREYVKSQYVRKKRPLLEMNRYKYLLSMEVMMQPGWNGCLYYNSVDVMSQPTAATWAMKDLLVPFIHYISSVEWLL